MPSQLHWMKSRDRNVTLSTPVQSPPSKIARSKTLSPSPPAKQMNRMTSSIRARIVIKIQYSCDPRHQITTRVARLFRCHSKVNRTTKAKEWNRGRRVWSNYQADLTKCTRCIRIARRQSSFRHSWTRIQNTVEYWMDINRGVSSSCTRRFLPLSAICQRFRRGIRISSQG